MKIQCEYRQGADGEPEKGFWYGRQWYALNNGEFGYDFADPFGGMHLFYLGRLHYLVARLEDTGRGWAVVRKIR